VVSKTSGLKRNAFIAEWRKLHEGLYSLFSSPNVIKLSNERRCDGQGTYHLSEGKSEGTL
jgi:hypothetical protein